jgi:hypothetical protein
MPTTGTCVTVSEVDTAEGVEMTMDIDALVELPTYRPAPAYEATTRPTPPSRSRRLTLLDRLVAQAGVDRVVIDVAALERDIDSLRDA